MIDLLVNGEVVQRGVAIVQSSQRKPRLFCKKDSECLICGRAGTRVDRRLVNRLSDCVSVCLRERPSALPHPSIISSLQVCLPFSFLPQLFPHSPPIQPSFLLSTPFQPSRVTPPPRFTSSSSSSNHTLPSIPSPLVSPTASRQGQLPCG